MALYTRADFVSVVPAGSAPCRLGGSGTATSTLSGASAAVMWFFQQQLVCTLTTEQPHTCCSPHTGVVMHPLTCRPESASVVSGLDLPARLNNYVVGDCRYSWTALMINQFEANDPVWLEGKTVLVRPCLYH